MVFSSLFRPFFFMAAAGELEGGNGSTVAHGDSIS